MAALASIGTWLASSGVGSVLGLVGTGVTAVGTIAAGQAAAEQGAMAQRAGELEAQQLEVQAKEERAVAQRQALQYRRGKKLALSQLQARSAASGFTATDPTSLALVSEIERYGTYQEQLAMFGGESSASRYRNAAAGRRYSGAMSAYEGKVARSGSYLNAAGTIMGGASTFASKYAKNRPLSINANDYHYR